MVVLLAAATVAVGPGGSVLDPGPAQAAALDELEGRFLTTRPSVGPTFVVNVSGEPQQRILLARTLQGLVNRTEARMYVIDGGDPAAQGLLDRYVARGLVTVAGSGTLDDALSRYAAEVSGYVVADLAEPWSVHGAAVIASVEGGVVATPDQVALVQSMGLSEIDDTRGRWPDASTAYLDLAAGYRDRLPSKTVAIVRSTDTLWDFVVQQGILPVFARPSDGDWSTVVSLLQDVPDGSPVYGYVSDTGDEEAVALAVLASTDLTLVPSDTTRNLSFHVAVAADRPRQRATPPDLSQVEPCSPDAVNVVVGVTDGDNMNVPLNHFLRPTNWDNPRRGELALGWSIGPGLAVLAPAAWDIYAQEATPNDELVAMIGWSYGAPALLSDPSDFYTQSFRLMDELGMTSFWSLGGGLETPGAAYWSAFDAAADANGGVPDAVLVGYGNAVGSAFHSPGGRPAFTSRSVYGENPTQIAAHISALLETPPVERPLVSFLSATNWSNPVGELIAALVPFEDQGVRFLTPAAAAACMPAAPEPPPPPMAGPGTCLPVEPIVEHGLALISNPVASEIARVPLPFGPATEVTVDPTGPVSAGDTVEYRAEITIDLDALAAEMLETRVKPVVQAGYGPELAATAWMAFEFDNLEITFPAPAGTSGGGTPTVISPAEGVAAAWDGDSLVVRAQDLAADSRSSRPPVEIAVSWSVTVDAAAPPGGTIELVPGPLAFDLVLDVGVVLGEFPLTGGVTTSWTCVAAEEVLASIDVAEAPVVDPEDPTPPTSSTTTTTTTTSSTTSSTTITSTTTTDPSVPSTTGSIPAVGPTPGPPPPVSAVTTTAPGRPISESDPTVGVAPAAEATPGRPSFTG